MAIAQAAGIPSPSVANMTAYIASPQVFAAAEFPEFPRISETATVSANSARKVTPTNASHLICWRSSPCRLRNRATRDAPARTAASKEASPVAWLRTCITPPAPRMPVGLITRTGPSCANAPVMRPGVRANKSAVTAGAAQASHSTGRQRREGTRPSG